MVSSERTDDSNDLETNGLETKLIYFICTVVLKHTKLKSYQ